MRFTLYIDTDRAPDGPTTWDDLIGHLENEVGKIKEWTDLLPDPNIVPTPLMKIQSYEGYFTIGGYKVTP